MKQRLPPMTALFALLFHNKIPLITIIITWITVLFISGCQSPPSPHTLQLNNNHQQTNITTRTGLPITVWLPTHQKASSTLRVYIEGDGRAWVRRSRMSSDPTPHNRLVHALILKDKKTDTAYLGRPCQFSTNTQCKPVLWTFSRYDASIVNAMDEALDYLKAHHQYKKIELVGFSGGATIALLLAAHRQDIVSVRTVAGNLDPAFTNTLHNVSPMPNALNPTHHTARLQHIPQFHFVGADDPIVKPAIIHHYRSAFQSKAHCIQYKVLPNTTHHDGWIEQWEQLLNNEPHCMTQQ